MNPITLVLAALNRMAALLRLADQEHTHSELLINVRAIAHEHQTAVAALSALGGDITANRPGSARSGDPGTSKAAARAIATRTGSQRHRILQALLIAGTEGATDPELQAQLVMVDSSQRTRRNELCQAGYVREVTVPLATDGPERVTLTRPRELTGHECIVWEITDLGRSALRKLDSGQMVLAFIEDTEEEIRRATGSG